MLRRILFRFLSFFRLTRAEADLSREIDSHLLLLEDEYVAKGMTRAAARHAARRSFGGVEQVKEHQRDARGFRWLENSRIDVRLGARMLRKYPGLSVIGGAGLAVGIAISTAFFAFFYSYIYATLPVPEGDRVVGVENWDINTNNEVREAAHDFVTWRDELKTVQELGAFRTVGRNLQAPGASPEPIRIAEITAAGLALPHQPPRLGRLFSVEDESPGARPVMLIGSDVWASRFNGDPNVIGREVRVGNTVRTIIGVMPDGFEFPINHSYWTPLHLEPETYPRRQGPSIFIFGRLAPGVSMTEAQSELSAIASRASTQFPDTHATLRARVMPYGHPIMDIQGVTSWQFAVMQFTVSLLLVIVALNVSILIYARTATRQGEIAMRTALGASRARLVAQLFIEALVLCGASAAAGLLLAQVGIRLGHSIMETEVGRLPYFMNPGIPTPTYLYVALLTVVAAAIAGVVPALQSTGRRMQTTLKQFGSSSGLRLGATWTLLIVGQVAFAVAGLPIAIASVWGDISGASTQMAFEPRPYLAARLTSDLDAPPGVDAAEYRRSADIRMAKLYADLEAQVESERVVEDVATALIAPGNEGPAPIEIDRPAVPASGAITVRFNDVSADFFSAFDVRLIAGRYLTSADAASAAHPVVVNEAFVRKLLGNRDAIGTRLRYTANRHGSLESGERPDGGDRPNVAPEPWHEIVGVVSDLYINRIDPARVNPAVFHSLAAGPGVRPILLIKVRGRDASDFAARLREITTALDPTVRLNVRPFVEMERQQQLALRLILLVMSLIVTAVLMLSAAGIYALMSFTVSRRRKEIGIRAAMGADSGQLLRGIFARAAAQLGTGVAIGAALAFLVDVMSGGEVLGATGRLVFVPAIAVMMIGVGLIASFGPARRGLKVQPTEALRAE